MKLRIVVGVLSLSVLGLGACKSEEQSAEQPAEQPKAQEGQPAAAAQPAAEQPKAPEVSPKDVCEQAIAAAKAKDEAKVLALVSGELTAEGAKEHLTAVLAAGTCGEPKLDGDKGAVAVTAGAGKKAKATEIPLVKAADGWKIDAAAFIEKNPAKKAKKGAKVKKGKKK